MSPKRVLLSLHLLAILLGVGYFLLSVTVGATPDANIGAGLALLWLTALGLPWSGVAYAPDPDTAWLAVALGTALLNLGIHALLWRLAGRRRDPS